jgi:RNA polymerase primary sigma factor
VRDETAGILRTLSPKEEKAIWMRAGIGCEREHTLEEIGTADRSQGVTAVVGP